MDEPADFHHEMRHYEEPDSEEDLEEHFNLDRDDEDIESSGSVLEGHDSSEEDYFGQHDFYRTEPDHQAHGIAHPVHREPELYVHPTHPEPRHQAHISHDAYPLDSTHHAPGEELNLHAAAGDSEDFRMHLSGETYETAVHGRHQVLDFNPHMGARHVSDLLGMHIKHPEEL